MMQQRATVTEEQVRLGVADYVWQDGQLRDARGRKVPLRAKSLKMFAVLLAERGKILTKDRLSDLVWSEVTTTDESIARCIADKVIYWRNTHPATGNRKPDHRVEAVHNNVVARE